jgi:hypothetical protein
LLFWSLREPVPFARLCISFVLLVSNLYCKLVLLFLIYTFLTFDQKKKKELFCRVRRLCMLAGVDLFCSLPWRWSIRWVSPLSSTVQRCAFLRSGSGRLVPASPTS